jgi:hypothetical protein
MSLLASSYQIFPSTALFLMSSLIVELRRRSDNVIDSEDYNKVASLL